MYTHAYIYIYILVCLRKEDLEIEKQSNNEIENNYKENINQISDEEEILDILPKFATSNIPNLVANYESVSEESKYKKYFI